MGFRARIPAQRRPRKKGAPKVEAGRCRQVSEALRAAMLPPCRAEARTSPQQGSNQPKFDMAAFIAVATQEGRDANTPFPLLRMVGEYLTINQLMPPCRLRWSRALRRPLMERWWDQRTNYDEVGSCYIEELHVHEVLITGKMHLQGLYPQPVMELSSLHRGHTRAQIWDVVIIDPDFEDAPYAEAWMHRYGAPWPFTGQGSVHPVLRNLHLVLALLHLCDPAC